MKNRICPVCGSEELKEMLVKKVLSDPFAGDRTFDVYLDECSDCGSKGDFFDQNSMKITQNVKELKREGVIRILDALQEQKISMAAIERALELPQRTLAKWKSKNAFPSASGVALLRFISLFPWLLEIAEKGFEFSKATQIHVNSAMESLLEMFNSSKFTWCSAQHVSTDSNASMLIELYKEYVGNLSEPEIEADLEKGNQEIMWAISK